MKTSLRALFIACAAGITGGFFIPLPVTAPPASRSAAKSPATPAATSAPLPGKEPPLPDTPVNPAALAAEECPAALDALLRTGSVSPLTPEKQQQAITLLLRILRDTSGGGEYLRTRRLPAGLIAGAWLDKPDDVPESLRIQLPLLFAGEEAARRIVRSLALTDDTKATALADTLPAAWRPALREAALLGLAARDPLRAVRSGPVSEDFYEDVAFAAARSAPMEDAIKVITGYVDDDFYVSLKPMLALLHARDAAKTADLVAAAENPKLKKWLAEVTAAAAAATGEPVTPSQQIASLTNPESMSPREREQARTALAFQAVQNPAAAQAVWETMPAGLEKDQAATSLAAALAEQDAAAALAWADKNSPRSSFDAFRVYCASDPLAALTDALRLPESNPLREQILKDLRKNPAQPQITGLFSPNAAAIVRELPAELQKLFAPEPAIPFDGP